MVDKNLIEEYKISIIIIVLYILSPLQALILIMNNTTFIWYLYAILQFPLIVMSIYYVIKVNKAYLNKNGFLSKTLVSHGFVFFVIIWDDLYDTNMLTSYALYFFVCIDVVRIFMTYQDIVIISN